MADKPKKYKIRCPHCEGGIEIWKEGSQVQAEAVDPQPTLKAPAKPAADQAVDSDDDDLF